MSARMRTASMLAVAVALVAGVLMIQLINGGGRFEPLEPADPCAAREVTSRSDGIEGLTERLVLVGIDGAACRLQVSRETLTLRLGQPGVRTDAEIAALHEGLQSAVRRMDDEGSLPSASDLVDEAIGSADLNRFLEAAIRALPDRVIDSAVTTDDVLVRAIDELDLRAVLADLGDQGDLNRQVEVAVTQAVKDSLAARVRGLI